MHSCLNRLTNHSRCLWKTVKCRFRCGVWSISAVLLQSSLVSICLALFHFSRNGCTCIQCATCLANNWLWTCQHIFAALGACSGKRIQYCMLDYRCNAKEVYQQAPTGSNYAQILAMADQSCSILLKLFGSACSSIKAIEFRPELKCKSQGWNQTLITINFNSFLKSNAKIIKCWLIIVM